jgi:hypothetical protein
MALIVNTLPAAAGVGFVREGWQLFKRQPLGLPAMTVIYLALRYLPLVLIPYLGLALSAVLAPFAVVGMMNVCRDVAQGRVPLPPAFAKPFGDAGARRGLINLALIHMVISVVLGVLIAFAMPDLRGEDLSLEELARATPPWLIGVTFLLELLVLMLMWFAPLFVAWHGEPAVKALFFSLVAVWRNRAAFALLAAALLLVIFVVAQLAGVVVALLSSAVAGLLIAPLGLLLLAFVQCAAYASYAAVVARA